MKFIPIIKIICLFFAFSLQGNEDPAATATFIISSQDSAERGNTRSKRSGLHEEGMAIAMSDEENRSGEAAAGRIPDEMMKVAAISYRAEALWEAQDYAGANELYEHLLESALPEWQKARVYYNLGTVKLSEGQNAQALKFFQKIVPTDLSLPRFGRNLLINEGIAYLQFAEELPFDPPLSLEPASIYVAQSIRLFNQAQAMDCQSEKGNHENNPLSSCISSPQIDLWLQAARLKLSTIQQERVRQWLKNSSQTSLEPLEVKNDQDFQSVRLNFELLLLQENPTIDSLNNLLVQLEALKVDKESKHWIDSTKEMLEKSLKDLKNSHLIHARFFLIAGFSTFCSLFQTNGLPPMSILQGALDQASRAFQLLLLSKLMSSNNPEHDLVTKTLVIQQEYVLLKAQPFIPAVLKEQTTLFEQAKNRDTGCQEFPWDQVIPLFDRGVTAARDGHKKMEEAASEQNEAASFQVETIKAWQQALKLLSHPPTENLSSSKPQNLAETYRQVQEMLLEDQPAHDQKDTLLHTW
jgi:tetratricopeptide (TPR) repeat protein